MLAVVLCRHAIYAAPLNVDEETTILIARRSFSSIVHVVFGDRGGGPLHFFLEHGTLAWPGGLVGLRAPSLVFFVLALPAVAYAGRALVGTAPAAIATLLFSVSPLAVSYGTFGRPHTMLVAWDAWAFLAVVRAAREGGRRWWLVGALVLASSILVHPLAPLYAGAILVAGLVLADRQPRVLAREVWPALVLALALITPYYVHTLTVLDERYVQGTNRHGGRSFSGLPVWKDAVSAIAPAHGVFNLYTLLALAGLALIAWRSRRVAAAMVILIATPVVFFSVVPAKGNAGIFFSRYMLPVLPAFLLLVGAGVVGIGMPLARERARVAVWLGVLALLAGSLALRDIRRNRTLDDLQLTRLTHEVAARRATITLFGVAGPTPFGSDLGRFTFGRPAALLDRYLALRIDSLRVVDDDTCTNAVRSLRAGGRRTGLWLFYVPDDATRPALAALRAVPGVQLERLSTLVWAAHSSRAGSPRALLRTGLALRLAWIRAVPSDQRTVLTAQADRQTLVDPAGCKPFRPLDDPDAFASPVALDG